MESIHFFDSIVDDSIKEEIGASWCTDLQQYATYKCNIGGLIAASHLFCPKIIQVKEYVFIEKFWNCNREESLERIKMLEIQYSGDKKAIEMSVNTWSIGDFFVGETDELMNNIKVLEEFGKAICYFWGQRARELFPNKNIIVELGENLMGELGLCITMYEE